MNSPKASSLDRDKGVQLVSEPELDQEQAQLNPNIPNAAANVTLELTDTNNSHNNQNGINSNSTKNININEYKILTWNVWCIPLGSPRTLSNPLRCSEFVKQYAINDDWLNFNGLIIMGIQELWGWKTGIMPGFILSYILSYFEYIPYIGRLLSAISQLISSILGVFLFRCLSFKYNPKKVFYKNVQKWLPFAMYDTTVPFFKLADSGLLLLSNVEPIKWGFECYQDSKCDDSMTNKGFIHAYFELVSNNNNNNINKTTKRIMVINTHLQAAGDCTIRMLQLQQIRRFLDEFERFESEILDEIIILGDFNSDMSTHKQRAKLWIKKNEIDLTRFKNIRNNINNNSKTANIDINQETNEERKEQNNSVNMDSVGIGARVYESDNENRSMLDKNNSDSVISNDILNDINLIIAQNEKNDQKNGNTISDLSDPLTSIPYSKLPSETVPEYVRNILEQTEINKSSVKKYIKKAYINIPYYLGSKYMKVNTYEYTFKRGDYNIDHIFVNFKYQIIKNELLAEKSGVLSDHKMVVSHFKSV